jgi:methylenetetrahydrofolate dehydrogenase (NADP+) / methenyltetrahydrofolate cyclohydrolase
LGVEALGVEALGVEALGVSITLYSSSATTHNPEHRTKTRSNGQREAHPKLETVSKASAPVSSILWAPNVLDRHNVLYYEQPQSILLSSPALPVAQILDGNSLSQAVRDDVKADVDAWTGRGHRPPCLRVVLIGSNPASEAYVRGKERDAREAGIDSETLRFGEDITENDLLRTVDDLNTDPDVDGLLVQLPLPDHIDDRKVINAIDPSKDVDGFHPENLGRLLIGSPSFIPATPFGIVEMLRRAEIDTEGMRAVIVGRSNIVGKPLAALLMQRDANATVTVCHSRTRDLAAHTAEADLVVAAVGRPEFITADMVKDGAVVVDVGIDRKSVV